MTFAKFNMEWCKLEFTGSTLRIMIFLFSRTGNYNQSSEITIKDICQATNIKRLTAIRCINTLKGVGVINTGKTRNNINIYSWNDFDIKSVNSKLAKEKINAHN